MDDVVDIHTLAITYNGGCRRRDVCSLTLKTDRFVTVVPDDILKLLFLLYFFRKKNKT